MYTIYFVFANVVVKVARSSRHFPKKTNIFCSICSK